MLSIGLIPADHEAAGDMDAKKEYGYAG